MSLRVGDVVVLGDKLGVGVVRHVGNLKNKKLGRFVPMVGIELGTEIGNSDGRYGGKRYFTCEKKCGVFLQRDRVKKKLRPEDLLQKLNDCLESLEALNAEKENAAKEELLKAPAELKHKRMNSVSAMLVQKEKLFAMTAKVQELEASNQALKDHLRLIAECTATLGSINPFYADMGIADFPDIPSHNIPSAGPPARDPRLPRVSSSSAKDAVGKSPKSMVPDPEKQAAEEAPPKHDKEDKVLPVEASAAESKGDKERGSAEKEVKDAVSTKSRSRANSSKEDVKRMHSLYRMESAGSQHRMQFMSPPNNAGANPHARKVSSKSAHMTPSQANEYKRMVRSQTPGQTPKSSRPSYDAGAHPYFEHALNVNKSFDFDAVSMKSFGAVPYFDDADVMDYHDPATSRVSTILTDHFLKFLDFESESLVDLDTFVLAVRKFEIDETVLSDHDLQTLFRRIDTDRSRSIELQEFVDFLENPNQDEIALTLIKQLEEIDAREQEEMTKKRKERKRQRQRMNSNTSIDLRQASMITSEQLEDDEEIHDPSDLVEVRDRPYSTELDVKLEDMASKLQLEGVMSPTAGPMQSEEDKKYATLKYYYGRRLQECLVPTNAPPDHILNMPPRKRIKLTHVFGYKGNNLYRNNLHITHDLQHIVYNTSNIVVIHNIKRNSQSFFTSHAKEVTSIALWPDSSKDIVASGQAPDATKKGVSTILVWDAKTKKILRKYDSDARGSVVGLEFSRKFRMLYALNNDENHTLMAFTLNKGSSLPVLVCVISKSNVFGFNINHNTPKRKNDTLIAYGKKTLKYFDVWKENKGKKVQYMFKWRTVRTGFRNEHFQEKAFHCCCFLKETPDVYIVGGHSGCIYLCNNSTLLHRELAHDAAVTCLTATKRGFISSSLDGMWQIWECDGKELKYLKKGFLNKDNEAIRNLGGPRSMAYDPSSGDLLVGCRSNQILKVSTGQKKRAEILMESHFDKVTSVVCHPTENTIATGSGDEFVRLWSLDERRAVVEGYFHAAGEPVSTLVYSYDAELLIAGLETSAILCFAPGLKYVGRHDFVLKSDASAVNCLAFSAHNRLLAVGFSSGDIFVCTVRTHKNSNVTVVEWPTKISMTSSCLDVQFSEDTGILRAFSKDYEIMNFQVDRKNRVVEHKTSKHDPDREFIGKPIRAGWEVRGLYQPGFDGSFLSCCNLSNDRELIVSGDRTGALRLHNYPAIYPAMHALEEIHSTTVLSICFNPDDDKIISVGGDGCVMIWTVYDAPVKGKDASFQKRFSEFGLRKLSDMEQGSTRKLGSTASSPFIRKLSDTPVGEFKTFE